MNPVMNPVAPLKERTLIPVKEKIFEVNPFVDEWLKALRSGEYSQIRRFLRTKKGYCCLGVAAEAVIGVEWGFDHINGVYQYSDGVGAFDYEVCLQDVDAGLFDLDFLVSESEFYNMNINKKDVRDSGDTDLNFTRMDVLIYLNDSYGKDFKFIADTIEAQGWHLKLAA